MDSYYYGDGMISVPYYDGWICEHCGYHMYRETPYCDNCGGKRP